MEQALLIDSDRRHAAEITAALQAAACRFTVVETIRDAISFLRKHDVEAIILSADQQSDWQKDVGMLVEQKHPLGLQIPIFCLLRGSYRGPANRIWGARRGVRVVYEQF